jgi:phage shock protein C
MSTTHTTHEGTRRLVRRTDDRMIAGVCSGVADYLGVDVTLVRLIAVVAAVLGFGTLIVAYLVAWVLMPQS